MSKDPPPNIRLSAEIGTEMTIELPSLKNRIKLRLIGLLKDEYLIFHLPKKIQQLAPTDGFSSGIEVNVRSISRGSVFGFHALILSKHSLGESVLFVSYPNLIQKQVIRKNLRVKCLLPAKLSPEETTLLGTVADISRGGCHFQAKKEFFSIEQVKSIQVDKEMKFFMSLPGINGEKEIDVKIINISLDHEKVEIGLAFNNLNPELLKLIDDIIAMSFDISPL